MVESEESNGWTNGVHLRIICRARHATEPEKSPTNPPFTATTAGTGGAECERSERAVKAITIHQPWASLIAHGYKRFETRGWRTNYRGPLAIHAGKKIDHQAVLMIARDYPRIWRDITPLPSGSIVAVAELVECRKAVGVVIAIIRLI